MKSLTDIQNEVCRILSASASKLIVNKPKKITVLLIGRHHEDNTAHSIVSEQIRRIFSAGIKTVVCSELPCDTVLEEVIRLQSRDLSLAKEIFELHSLLYVNNFELTTKQQETFIEKSVHKEIFSLSLRSTILQLKHGQLFSKICFQIPVLESQLKLYKFMQENKIPYHGLEFKSAIHKVIDKSFDPNKFHDWFLQWEPLRIPNLATNLRGCIAQLKDTGGVVITEDLGLLHVHRLAGCLSKQLIENGIENVEIVPVELIPDVRMMDEIAFVTATVKKDLQHYVEDSALFASKDPEYLKQYYAKNPLQTWRWSVNDILSANHTCPNGEKSINAIIEAHKASSKIYDSLKQNLESTNHNDFLVAYERQIQKVLTTVKSEGKPESEEKPAAVPAAVMSEEIPSVKRTALLCSAESSFTWADVNKFR